VNFSFNYTMNTQITLKKIVSSADIKHFIDFPHQLYAGDPNYVPELFVSQKALLNRKTNPFFQHGTADYFLAFSSDGKAVGRIATIHNQLHIDFTGEKTGFFGFFDAINDVGVAQMLLDKAVEYARDHGMENLTGPVNFSTNETCGALIENFDHSPYLMTTYNYAYYKDLLEDCGFKKHTDLLSYELLPDQMPSGIAATGALLEKRLANHGISIRTINMRDFNNEISHFLKVYNASWEKNLGFVPMTEAEVRQMGQDLKMIIDPAFVYFAEKDGKVIGAALSLPNLNEILINIPKGRLFPTGLFKILMRKKSIKSVRVIALGILPGYRRLGLDMCFYVRSYQTAKDKSIVHAEASWILEDNLEMNRALLHIGGKVYRKHRIYQKNI